MVDDLVKDPTGDRSEDGRSDIDSVVVSPVVGDTTVRNDVGRAVDPGGTEISGVVMDVGRQGKGLADQAVDLVADASATTQVFDSTERVSDRAGRFLEGAGTVAMVGGHKTLGAAVVAAHFGEQGRGVAAATVVSGFDPVDVTHLMAILVEVEHILAEKIGSTVTVATTGVTKGVSEGLGL